MNTPIAVKRRRLAVQPPIRSSRFVYVQSDYRRQVRQPLELVKTIGSHRSALEPERFLLPQLRQHRRDSLGFSLADEFNHDFLTHLFPANGLGQTPHVRN
jgi:hypothetical protein